MDDRKAMILYLPEDAELLTVAVMRQIPHEDEEGNVTYQNGIITSCADANVDAYDCVTGNTFVYSEEKNEWIVYDSIQENPNMPYKIELDKISFEDDLEVLEQFAAELADDLDEEIEEKNLQNSEK